MTADPTPDVRLFSFTHRGGMSVDYGDTLWNPLDFHLRFEAA